MHHTLPHLQPAARLSECRLLNVITVPERRGRRLYLWPRPSNYAAQDRKERLCRRWRFGWQVSISGSVHVSSKYGSAFSKNLTVSTSQKTWVAELFFICRKKKKKNCFMSDGSSDCASFVNSVLNPLTFPENITVCNAWRIKGLTFTEGMHIARRLSV